jgi:uncharacterized protein YajQ (UPF0234 family)
MPSFDVVSEIDMQEVRNAVDQTSRELATRFDFKGTESKVVLDGGGLTLESVSPDRLAAVRTVLEEKMVRRQVSLKALSYGRVEEAAGGRARQRVDLQVGINSDRARELNKLIKGLGIKGVQSQTQGDQLRVISKKRDSLQEVITALKEADLDLPLQYINFRD